MTELDGRGSAWRSIRPGALQPTRDSRSGRKYTCRLSHLKKAAGHLPWIDIGGSLCLQQRDARIALALYRSQSPDDRARDRFRGDFVHASLAMDSQ